MVKGNSDLTLKNFLMCSAVMLSAAAQIAEGGPFSFSADVYMFCYILNETEHTP